MVKLSSWSSYVMNIGFNSMCEKCMVLLLCISLIVVAISGILAEIIRTNEKIRNVMIIVFASAILAYFTFQSIDLLCIYL